MSLTVHTYQRRPDGQIDIMPVDPSEEIAGYESCRHELWGHPSVRSLGLSLLPTLAVENIYAEGEAVGQLQHEVEQMLEHVTEIAEAARYGEGFVARRCKNILLATHRAREIGGGVVIG